MFEQAAPAFPPGWFPRESPGALSVFSGIESAGLARDTYVQNLIMRMLLASNDVVALQPVAERLVARGIPIALEKSAEISSYLEIWIQRDSDFSLARKLLPADLFCPAAAQSPPGPVCAGNPQRSGGCARGASIATSRMGRWLNRLRHLR